MNWRPFDTNMFLKKSKYWPMEKAKLKKELDEMPELPSTENKSGVRSGNISDMTGQMAMRRLEIEAQIEEIELYEEMLRYGLSVLSEDEKDVINGFYFDGRAIGTFVWKYGRKSGICKDYVYAKRNRALKKMGDALLKKYYGED